MRSYPSGFLLFIVKSLATFLSLSLMYQLLTALIPVPLFVTCSFYDPCPETRQIAMVHQILHGQLFVPTLSGALRGALLSIPFTVLLTRLPERPQHLQLRWLLLGMPIGGGIGAFLRSFPIRWELWLLTRPHLCWNLGPYVLLDTSYFLNLITILLLALFFSLSHKSRNASPEVYRFGCRN